MAIIHFCPVVIQTFTRLDAVSDFLEIVDDAISNVESQQHDQLTQRAEQEGWQYGEFSVERDILNAKFRTWMPISLAYSVIVLLHSIAETQLYTLAEYLGQKNGSKLQVRDLVGVGGEQAALYLQRVLSIPVKADRAWCDITDLRKLRNIIVHAADTSQQTAKGQGDLEHLLRKYEPELRLDKADGIHEQLFISLGFCRKFVTLLSGFFERVFKSTGLPNRDMLLG